MPPAKQKSVEETVPKVSEPRRTQEAIDRAERERLLAMDEAFCASLTAAIKHGKEKQQSDEF